MFGSADKNVSLRVGRDLAEIIKRVIGLPIERSLSCRSSVCQRNRAVRGITDQRPKISTTTGMEPNLRHGKVARHNEATVRHFGNSLEACHNQWRKTGRWPARRKYRNCQRRNFVSS